MIRIVTALTVGLLAGTHAATWGMYKDAVYEGFSTRKFARSIVLGAAIAVAIALVVPLDLPAAPALILLFGLAYTGERFLSEFHKSFVRIEDQTRYAIPMAFAVGGRVVAHRGARIAAGGAYAGGIAACGMALLIIDRVAPDAWWIAALAGSTGGWISAFGGAWKDAPVEGFSWPKFFRSPLIALGYAALLAQLTHSLVIVAPAALGLTIASIETWKKFGNPDEPPGKFAGQPVRHPDMLERRRAAIPLYLAIWVLVAATLAMAVAGRTA